MRYLMRFSYDGSKFNGLQVQVEGSTIQGTIEEALTKINKKFVKLTATGRTDALVHAYNQYAHFDLDVLMSGSEVEKALNSLVGSYIYVKEVKEVANDFHARFDVQNKTYVYKINMGEYNPIEYDYVYQYCKILDIVKMKEASTYLLGKHNFKSFAKAKDLRESYERTIYDISFKENNNILEISFTGDGFLRYMVRNMVGFLIEVGSSKREAKEAITILNSQDRRCAGINVPANGLYLVDVVFKK